MEESLVSRVSRLLAECGTDDTQPTYKAGIYRDFFLYLAEEKLRRSLKVNVSRLIIQKGSSATFLEKPRDNTTDTKKQRKENTAAGAASGGEDSQSSTSFCSAEVSDRWILDHFSKWLALVFDELVDHEDPRLQVCGLRLLMRCITHEATVRQSFSPPNYSFPVAFYQVCVSRVLQSEHFSSELAECLLREFLRKYLDLRFYFLQTVKTILLEFVSKSSASISNTTSQKYKIFDIPSRKNKRSHISSFSAVSSSLPPPKFEWHTWTVSPHLLCSRLFQMLTAVRLPIKPRVSLSSTIMSKSTSATTSMENEESDNGEESDSEDKLSDEEDSSDSTSDSEGDDSWLKKPTKNGKLKKCFIANVNTTTFCEPKQYRLVFQSAWILYIRRTSDMIMSSPVLHQKVLRHLPNGVLPYVTNPLCTAEFFIQSYQEGNLSVSISALSGMFFLLTRYRLGDPDAIVADPESVESTTTTTTHRGANCHFYRRLYHLISPPVFSFARRVRFLRLIQLALRSSLLPSAFIASFIKKCARTACLVPPGSALWLIGLVHSLLQRYCTVCAPLVHVEHDLADKWEVLGDVVFDYGDVAIGHKDSDLSSSLASFQRHLETKEEEYNRKRKNENDNDRVRQMAQMALWELELLKKHYHPCVAQMAQVFDSDFMRVTAKKFNLDDLINIDYAFLISRELKVRRPRSWTTPPPSSIESSIFGRDNDEQNVSSPTPSLPPPPVVFELAAVPPDSEELMGAAMMSFPSKNIKESEVLKTKKMGLQRKTCDGKKNKVNKKTLMRTAGKEVPRRETERRKL